MRCSSPTCELITFWLAGSLSPAEAATVSAHVASCADCREEANEGRALMKGLAGLHLGADEIVAAAAGDLHSPHLLVCSRCRGEVEMLRAVNADLAAGAVSRAGWTRDWRLGLAAAAVLVLAIPLVWRVVRPPAEPSLAVTTIAEAPAPVSPALPPKLAVPKASLDSLANESVLIRGTPSPRQALLDDLAIALEPYRRDDFETSATRLSALAGKYPDAGEIPYYLGVCLLLLDRPAEAIAPLEKAVQRMKPAHEANRYLSIARANAAAKRRP
jgi:Putative zinc-finger